MYSWLSDMGRNFCEKIKDRFDNEIVREWQGLKWWDGEIEELRYNVDLFK